MIFYHFMFRIFPDLDSDGYRIQQAEAELCQAQVRLEVMFEVELNVGVEVVVEGTLRLWL